MQQQLISDNVICSIVLKDNSLYQVTSDLVQMYQATYPKIDIYDQLNQMAMWCFSNPAKRKTKTGILRFINSWLSRAKPAQALEAVSTRESSIQNDLSDRSWAL